MENKISICNTPESTIDHENNIFSTFFSGSTRIEIPLFQRGYKWDEDLISIFITDVTNHFNKSDSEPYFIGTLVSMNKDEGIVKSKVIVDGQQRLTTLTLAKTIFEINLANSPSDLVLASVYTTLIEKNHRWQKGLAPEPIKNLMNILDSKNLLEVETFDDLKKKIIDEFMEDEKLSEFQKVINTMISENVGNCMVWKQQIESKIIFANVIGSEEVIGRVYENINFKLLPLTSFELFKNKLFLKNLSLGNPIEENKINLMIIELTNSTNKLMQASSAKTKENAKEDFLRLVLMIGANRKIPATDSKNIIKFYQSLNMIEKDRWKNKDEFVAFFNSLNEIISKINKISEYALTRNTEESFIANAILRSSYVSMYNLINFWKGEIFDKTDLKKFFKWMLIEVVMMNKRFSGKNQFDFQFLLNEKYTSVTKVEFDQQFSINFKSEDWYQLKGYFDRAVLLIYEKHNKSNGARTYASICKAIRNANEINIEHIHPNKPDIKKESDKSKYVNFKFMHPNRNRIGNLGILEKLENGLAGNEPFNVKKEKYYNSSKFSLVNLENWNKKIFEQRADDILSATIVFFSK